MENRMTALENRFDTILPNLATKADVKSLEINLVKSSAQHQNSLNKLEIKLLDIIHQEIKSVCHKIDSNNWRMIVWMTTVVIAGFAGVFYVARYVPMV